MALPTRILINYSALSMNMVCHGPIYEGKKGLVKSSLVTTQCRGASLALTDHGNGSKEAAIVTYAAVDCKTQPLPPILIALFSCFAVPAHLKVEPPASLEATVGEDSLLRCQVAGGKKSIITK